MVTEIRMGYQKFSENHKKQVTKFITELNAKLPDCDGYKIGMKVTNDDSGYWLEINGEVVDSSVASLILYQAVSKISIS